MLKTNKIYFPLEQKFEILLANLHNKMNKLFTDNI